jgi:hypothetical protein
MESAIERFYVYVSFLFSLQVTRLLDLIVHSLYSHKEVFLRELARSVIFSPCTILMTRTKDELLLFTNCISTPPDHLNSDTIYVAIQ